MVEGRGNYTFAATQEFLRCVLDCYRMGKCLNANRPFRENHVRRYKAKCRADAIRSLLESSSASGTCFVAESDAIAHPGKSADDSSFPVFLVGSDMDTFYNSWPSKVTLKAGDGQTLWSEQVSSHCPFCAPWGKVNTLKELIEHLNTHHPNFTYRPRRNFSCAIIHMKINLDRENNVDPMFIVGSEGYMLSPRKRMNTPAHCDVAHREVVGYPFFVRRFKVPLEYGEYIPGAPGTIDAVLNDSQSDVSFATIPDTKASKQEIENENAKVSAPIKTSFAATHHVGSREVTLKLRIRPPTQPNSSSASIERASSSVRTPQRRAKRVALERKLWIIDSKVGSNEVEEELLVPDRNDSKRKANLKRKTVHETNQNDLKGMQNGHTAHMRATMLGTSARNRKAGGVGKPVISREAAERHLFHTSINIPLDVARYNSGFDSDDGDNDASFHSVDISSTDKYFFGLWDLFVNQKLTSRHGKAVFETVVCFVERFSKQIRKMNLEANVSSMVVHFWDLGLLDADGVMTVMQSFRDQATVEVGDEFQRRKEKKATDDAEPLYQGFAGISWRPKVDISELFPEEVGDQIHLAEWAATGTGNSDAWMATIFDSEKVEQERL